ncbi:DNA polymerase III subunit delta' [Providencia sneebia]|uniref:DNA polymerase III subunit delta' n=1 Tax=Providencia sneebia DSM 19967 TaxID=1141660 RepID=K8WJQ4_9GAMM|nr:DNA polymerase III subunit delta' [Providencia sneebia]EKT56395.1 DNA polymerase III subunit delta' [Providencia sneebia DSM 19967]
MKWFPWLNETYRQLVMSYQQNRGHHALLLHSLPGNGAEALCYGISRWLICQNKQGIKSCGECHSCQLMLAGTHPDYHILEPEKGKTAISVDAVRKLTEKLNSHAQQDGAKVTYIPLTEMLTDAAANALLKTLEEPTKETYFLLGCEKRENLLATLRSRCFYMYLSPPKQDVALYWLRQQQANINDNDAITALKLCQGAPIAAMSLLEPEFWQQRNGFCQNLASALEHHDMLSLLSVMNNVRVTTVIDWLLGLLTDSMKLQQNASQFCLNQDQLPLVGMLADKMTSSQLYDVYEGWQNCRQQLITVPALNQELLLTNQLLQWEALLATLTR